MSKPNPSVVNNRRDFIEGYIEKYPEAPKEMIIKLDLLTSGIWFSQEAMNNFDRTKYVHKSYRLFSWDSIKLTDDRRPKDVSWPEEIRISAGIFKLLPTVIQVRLNPESPYVVELVDGQPHLSINGNSIAEVQYKERPRYYDLSFDDGTKYYDVAPNVGWGTVLFSTVYRFCQFHTNETKCKYCDINDTLKGLKGLEQYARTTKKVDQLAEVARALWEENLVERPGELMCINITGGAILNKAAAGLESVEFYGQYVRAIREKTGHGPYIFLETMAQEKENWKAWKDMGTDGVRPNIEVWGEELFNVICPGKAREVGFKQWVKLLIDAADVFGGHNVQPVFVSGVEMCQPYGFKTFKEAVAHTRQGLEVLMSHGICPRLVPWHIEANSILGNNVLPPLDFFIQISLAWHELWFKYNLPKPSGQGPMGPGVSVMSHGVWMEASHFHR